MTEKAIKLYLKGASFALLLIVLIIFTISGRSVRQEGNETDRTAQ